MFRGTPLPRREADPEGRVAAARALRDAGRLGQAMATLGAPSNAALRVWTSMEIGAIHRMQGHPDSAMWSYQDARAHIGSPSAAPEAWAAN